MIDEAQILSDCDLYASRKLTLEVDVLIGYCRALLAERKRLAVCMKALEHIANEPDPGPSAIYAATILKTLGGQL